MVKKSDIPLVVILGPTASGKSSWGVELAIEYCGEIISADSRQVFKGLDIGSGKITKEEMKNVPHHLIDVCAAGLRFTVAQYKVLADAVIEEIIKNGHVPFLVGGSALYVDVVVENYLIPDVDQDVNYRQLLERQSVGQLCHQLERVDPVLFSTIDTLNKRRLIRALEVFHLTGKPLSELKKKGTDVYESTVFGIDMPREQLYDRIDARVDSRIKEGMIEEVEALLASGISSEWLDTLGLEYRFISHYILKTDRSEPSKKEMIQRLKFAIHDFARRQLIWFRAKKNIIWCEKFDQMRHFLNSSKDFPKQT